MNIFNKRPGISLKSFDKNVDIGYPQSWGNQDPVLSTGPYYWEMHPEDPIRWLRDSGKSPQFK